MVNSRSDSMPCFLFLTVLYSRGLTDALYHWEHYSLCSDTGRLTHVLCMQHLPLQHAPFPGTLYKQWSKGTPTCIQSQSHSYVQLLSCVARCTRCSFVMCCIRMQRRISEEQRLSFSHLPGGFYCSDSPKDTLVSSKCFIISCPTRIQCEKQHPLEAAILITPPQKWWARWSTNSMVWLIMQEAYCGYIYIFWEICICFLAELYEKIDTTLRSVQLICRNNNLSFYGGLCVQTSSNFHKY